MASIAVFALAGYEAMIYFRIRSDLSYEYLLLPGVLRGFAMLVIFILFSAYGMESVPKQIRLHNVFFTIALRSVIAALAGNCLFSNLLERRIFYYLAALAGGLEKANPLAAEYVGARVSSALASGNGAYEASQLAVNDIYQRVYAEAVVCATKEIMGYALIVTLAIAIATAMIRFRADLREKLAPHIPHIL